MNEFSPVGGSTLLLPEPADNTRPTPRHCARGREAGCVRRLASAPRELSGTDRGARCVCTRLSRHTGRLPAGSPSREHARHCLGRSPTARTRRSTGTRRRRRERRSGDCAKGSSLPHRTGDVASACRAPSPTLPASRLVRAVAATSKATSATTAVGGSTTCLAIGITNARVSVRCQASGPDALGKPNKPRRI